jgi:uncharacterized membrane protein YbjE (DUF340 family)
MLVFMGMSTAQNDEFLLIFTDSGKMSVMLAISGMLGSIFCTLPVYLYMKKRKNKSFSYKLYTRDQATERKNDWERQNTDHLTLNTSENVPQTNIESSPAKRIFTKYQAVLMPIISYIIGVFISLFVIRVDVDTLDNLALYSLYGLLLFVGISIAKLDVIDLIRRYHIMIIIVPFLGLIGSLIGGVIANSSLSMDMARESLSINAGMGYYSISAFINKSVLGDQIGLIALLTNLIRETLTMLCCPLLIRIFGPLAPISTGGATTMDTTLPFIRKHTTSEYTLIAFFNGVILTVVVPPLTTFIACY